MPGPASVGEGLPVLQAPDGNGEIDRLSLGKTEADFLQTEAKRKYLQHGSEIEH